jgi:hypothetical protein
MNSPRYPISRIPVRRSVVAAGLLLSWIPGSGDTASGLFNLELLEQHRAGIEEVQRAAEMALPRVTRGTDLANRWSVNPSGVPPSGLRVILFRSDAITNANEVTKTYTNACITSIPIKLVICDVRAFEGLMHHWGFDRTTDLGNRDWPTDVDVPTRSKNAEEQAENLLQIATWILGHEIGHLTVKSTESTADINSLLSDALPRRLTQTTEVLADQHVFNGSGLNEAERADLSGFLLASLNAELHLKYCPTRDVIQMCSKIPAGVGVIFDYNNPKGLDIDASKPHPEFLLRLIRLLELSRRTPDCESDGLCILLKEVMDRVHAVSGH